MYRKLSGFLILSLLFFSIAYGAVPFVYKIEGVSGEPLQNIRYRLNDIIKARKITSPTNVRRLYKQGKQEIKIALQPYGFFRAQINSVLFHNGKQWQAIYYINPGEPLRITDIQILLAGEGRNLPEFHQYLATQPIKKGDIFSIPNYNKFKTKLFQIAKNNGYLRAVFNNKILVNLKNYTSYIFVKLTTGPQFHFGPITYKNLPYSRQFIDRIITIREGEIYSSRRILKLQQKMEKSYYFTRAVFKPNFASARNLAVPIDVYLTPPPAESYSVGFGYGTLTGARASAAMSLRHLGNEGNHFESELKLSRVLSGAGGTFYFPGKDPLTEEWLAGVNYKRFKPNAGVSNSITFTGGYNKKYDMSQMSISLNYLTEQFFIYERPPSEQSHLLYPSWKFSFINADNMTNPTKAYSINITAQGAVKEILSTTSFAQLRTRPKVIFSPFSFSRIVLRGDLGLTAVRNLQVFPMSMQFFAGGINSIRGFAESSIGPGKYLAIASAEYQNRIKGSLYAAVFYDAGYATNHFDARVNRGAGIGLLYMTALGPLKLYAARALSKSTHPNSIEFSVGPEFS